MSKLILKRNALFLVKRTGSFLLKLAKIIQHPALDADLMMCFGNALITVNKITGWQCHIGQFDPIYLDSNILLRNGNKVAGLRQNIDLEPGQYDISLVGRARVSIKGGDSSIDGGSNTSIIENSSLNLLINSKPECILIELIGDNSNDFVSFVSITRKNSSENLLVNGDFDDVVSSYYDLYEWYVLQGMSSEVDPYSIGWIVGFENGMYYTMFRDPIEQYTPNQYTH